MKRLLVVVDMQNDFIGGALGTDEAKAIVSGVAEFVRNFDGFVVYTQDTHRVNYLETQEGKKLPVKHCIKDSVGWELNPEVKLAIDSKLFKSGGPEALSYGFQKNTFGSQTFAEWLGIHGQDLEEIHFIGVCTGICVISNAVIAKTILPEAEIYIHKDFCACVTPESHERALKSMETLQMCIV